MFVIAAIGAELGLIRAAPMAGISLLFVIALFGWAVVVRPAVGGKLARACQSESSDDTANALATFVLVWPLAVLLTRATVVGLLLILLLVAFLA